MSETVSQDRPIYMNIVPIINPWAQTFHIVDQLSHWSEFSHSTYDRFAAEQDWVSGRGQKLLSKEKHLREKRSWKQGWEDTLYNNENLRRSLKGGVKDGLISRPEARSMARILRHFRPKFQPWLKQTEDHLNVFATEIDKNISHAAKWVTRFEKMLGVSEPVTFPLFLVPSPDPDKFGGGANGGGLVVEVPSEESENAISTVIHEAFHMHLKPWKNTMNEMIRTYDKTGILTENTLEEGIMYAFAPGIVQDVVFGDDSLEKQVTSGEARGLNIQDHAVFRYAVYGLFLRPALIEALETEKKFEDFLIEAIGIWQKIK